MEGDHYRFLERSFGSFHRTVAFPDAVNPDNVEAELTDGVLTIRVMKAREGKTAKVKVKAR